MRILAFLIVLVLLSTAVFAIGMHVPPDFERIDLEADDGPFEFEFTVIGDSEDRLIEFFMRPAEDGYILFDGNTEFIQTISVDANEQVIIEVFDVEVLKDHKGLDVGYGFLYGGDDAGTVGFEQVISSVVEMDLEGPYVPLIEGELPDDSVGTGPQGAVRTVVEQSEDVEDVEGDLEDTSPQQSAMTTGVVDDSPRYDVPRESQQPLVAANVPEDGKGVVILIIGMLGVMMVLNVAVIRQVKGA